MEERIYKRGDIVFVSNPLQKSHGHVTAGDHPAVIIQNQKGNDHSGTLIIAYITSQIKRVELPTHVLIQWYPHVRPSIIQAEQIATISKDDVIAYWATLRKEDMVRLDRALRTSLGLGV